MKPIAPLELHVTRRGYTHPKRTPSRTLTDALTGFSFAARDDSVATVSVIENRKIESPTGNRLNVVAELVTFTRHGPQEFAQGQRAWWDSRPRKEAAR